MSLCKECIRHFYLCPLSGGHSHTCEYILMYFLIISYGQVRNYVSDKQFLLLAYVNINLISYDGV